MKLNDIITESKGKPQKPKQQNPVAKHSRNKSGAGAHKDKKKELKKRGPDWSDMDEGHLVAAKSDIIDSILRQIKDKALDDDTLIKNLASLINSTANPRFHNQPRGNWNLSRRDKEEMEPVPEDKGRGPTGIAYTLAKGHPDAEDPKTGEKYPERQTPAYKAKWKKRSGPGLKQYTGNKDVMKEASEEQIEAQIAQLQPLADKLEYGPQSARDITKQIKYSDTHMTIINELGALAEKLGLDEKELDYYENQVFDAKNKLESAIYEMEEFFDDKYKEVAYKIEELEMDLQDLEWEKNREQ